ncbi:MAG: hypothetical protein WCA38_20625 [Candidatus Acidiferrales bacterium]
MSRNVRLSALVIAAILGLLGMTACGGGNSSNSISVSVTPLTASVPVNGTQTFSANVVGTTNTAVTWTATGGGSIDSSGVYTAPSAVPSGSVTITATSQANSKAMGTATVTVTNAQAISVRPSGPTVSAGATQAFTATPATGVAWSVNGIAGGDCVAPPINSTTPCHGTISATGSYVAPLSPPKGQTVTITATAGSSSGTSTVTIVFSSASLTTTGTTGQYAVAFTGVDFVQGFPLDVAGSITTSGSPTSASGSITGGEIDINSGTAGLSIASRVTGGSFTVGANDGRTTLTILTNSTAVPSFTLQVTLASNQHALLIEFDTFATGSGTLDAQNTTSFTTLLNGNFSFGLSGIDSNFQPLVVAGTFEALNGSIPINSSTAPVNVQDLQDISFNTPVVTNDLSLSGSYSAPDTNGRGTIAMSSTPLGTITLAYYVTDQTHLKVVEIDASQAFIVTGDIFSAPTTVTGLNGGVALTFGGLAHGSSYAGGAVFTLSASSVSNGLIDINNLGASSPQNGNAITSGSYSNTTSAGSVPARYTLSLTTNKGTAMFAAYTFTTAAATGAEIVEIDNNTQGASGVAYQQGSISTPQGSYALNLTGVGFARSTGSFEQDLTGELVLGANSAAPTGALDFNNGGPISVLGISSTSTIVAPTNSRGTMMIKASASGQSATFNLVYYLVDANTILLFDSDGNRVANGVLARQF